jgi:hypothetical protein
MRWRHSKTVRGALATLLRRQIIRGRGPKNRQPTPARPKTALELSGIIMEINNLRKKGRK